MAPCWRARSWSFKTDAGRLALENHIKSQIKTLPTKYDCDWRNISENAGLFKGLSFPGSHYQVSWPLSFGSTETMATSLAAEVTEDVRPLESKGKAWFFSKPSSQGNGSTNQRLLLGWGVWRKLVCHSLSRMWPFPPALYSGPGGSGPGACPRPWWSDTQTGEYPRVAWRQTHGHRRLMYKATCSFINFRWEIELSVGQMCMPSRVVPSSPEARFSGSMASELGAGDTWVEGLVPANLGYLFIVSPVPHTGWAHLVQNGAWTGSSNICFSDYSFSNFYN